MLPVKTWYVWHVLQHRKWIEAQDYKLLSLLRLFVFIVRKEMFILYGTF